MDRNKVEAQAASAIVTAVDTIKVYAPVTNTLPTNKSVSSFEKLVLGHFKTKFHGAH